MNEVRKVRGSYLRLSDQRFYVLTYTIYKAMLENSNFKTPQPSLATLKGCIDEFEKKLSISSRRGSPHDTALKNDSRTSLAGVLSALAFYVNQSSGGNLSILLSSGFKLAKPFTRSQVPEPVNGLNLRDGRQRGQMVLSFNAQKGTRIYKYKYTDQKELSGDVLWSGEEFLTTSSMNNVIAPVEIGTEYFICVKAINVAGEGDWSEPASWIAR